MKKILAATVTVLLGCFIGQASASIIEVEFTGLAAGIRPTSTATTYDIGYFSNKPFTAEFAYNTDNGVIKTLNPSDFGCIVTCYQLSGGLVNASISLEGIGTLGGDGGFFAHGGLSFLIWQEDLNFAIADAGDTYYRILLSNDFTSTGKFGSFQFGLCPTVVGGPCGYMTSIESMTITSVPGPLVGGGLPGLLLAGSLLIWRRFRPAVFL